MDNSLYNQLKPLYLQCKNESTLKTKSYENIRTKLRTFVVEKTTSG